MRGTITPFSRASAPALEIAHQPRRQRERRHPEIARVKIAQNADLVDIGRPVGQRSNGAVTLE